MLVRLDVSEVDSVNVELGDCELVEVEDGEVLSVIDGVAVIV